MATVRELSTTFEEQNAPQYSKYTTTIRLHVRTNEQTTNDTHDTCGAGKCECIQPRPGIQTTKGILLCFSTSSIGGQCGASIGYEFQSSTGAALVYNRCLAPASSP